MMTFWEIVGARMITIEIDRFRKGVKNNIVFGSIVFFPWTFVYFLYVLKPLLFGLGWVP